MGKNPLKWAIIPFFKCSKILLEASKPRNYTTNVGENSRSQIIFRQIFFENCRRVSLNDFLFPFFLLDLNWNLERLSSKVPLYNARDECQSKATFIEHLKEWSPALFPKACN